jgi:hypothetical protein
MKHITFADKSLLVDDRTADLLLEYAALLADRRKADTVDVIGIEPNGNEVTATFLLDAGAPLMAESTNATMTPPDNAEATTYMRERIMLLSSPPAVRPDDESIPSNYQDLHL